MSSVVMVREETQEIAAGSSLRPALVVLDRSSSLDYHDA
jgi:hypothetical protein